MKRINAVALGLISCLSVLTSCGGDISGGSYVKLEFNPTEVNELFIEYSNRDDTSRNIKYRCSESSVIQDIYDYLELFHTNKKTTTKDLSDYNSRFAFYFVSDSDVFDFKSYVFGRTTYFVYKDEIHDVSIDFEGTMFTELNNLSDSLARVS